MLRYAARWDCGAKFQLVVRLLDKHEKEVDSFEREVVITEAAHRKIWHKVHSFYLSFTSSFSPGFSHRPVLQAVFTLCLCCGQSSLKGGEGHHQSDKHGNNFKGDVEETSERRDVVYVGFSECIDTILN